MSIYIADALVIQRGHSPLLGLNAPVFGWKSVITAVDAEQEDADYPASNLLNDLTNAKWMSDSTSAQSLTFDLVTEEPVDYIAIARHNFGSGKIEISVKRPDPENEGEFLPLYGPLLPSHDGVILIRVDPIYLSQIVIDLAPDAEAPVAPSAAVIYIGKLLEVARGLPPPHTPITRGFRTDIQTNRSMKGDFLGSVMTDEGLGTSIFIDHLNGAWFLAEMMPFIRHAKDRNPFFWAWSPQQHPDDVAFCWCVSDPDVPISEVTELVNVSLSIEGVPQ